MIGSINASFTKNNKLHHVFARRGVSDVTTKQHLHLRQVQVSRIRRGQEIARRQQSAARNDMITQESYE